MPESSQTTSRSVIRIELAILKNKFLPIDAIEQVCALSIQIAISGRQQKRRLSLADNYCRSNGAAHMQRREGVLSGLQKVNVMGRN